MRRKSEKLFRVILWVGVAVLITTMIVSVILRTSSLNNFYQTGKLPHPDTIDYGYSKNPKLTLLHIIPGLLFLLLGAMQFIKALRNHFIKFHRFSGKIYLLLGVLVGITALIMGIKIKFGGVIESSAVVVFTIWFLYCLVIAYIKIRKRNFIEHREWMIRAYSIGIAVATMRPVIGLFFAFTNIRFQDFFGSVFWIAFILHAIVAELWIRFTRRSSSAQMLNPL